MGFAVCVPARWDRSLEAAAPRKARLRIHIQQPLRLFVSDNPSSLVKEVGGCSLHAVPNDRLTNQERGSCTVSVPLLEVWFATKREPCKASESMLDVRWYRNPTIAFRLLD